MKMAGRTGSLGHLRLSPVPLLLAATFIFFATRVSYADDIFLTVNLKKPLALTSDKFLSYTLDPTVVLTGDALTRNPERSINMARALSPAYVRIGGPRSNSYTFVRPHQMYYEQDPHFTITESNWIDVNRWAENAGLDILVCITPQHTEIGGGDFVLDSRNALDLIAFSDHMGFNTSWQLGYECQTRCDVSGIDGGKAVMRLRSMLDAFPRYSKSLVTGPDVVAYRTKQQQQYLQDYLNVAGNALSAITWHPNFSGITLDDEGVSMQHDTLASDKDSLYRSVGRPIWKKPLWIAESKPEDCKKQFLGALVWTRRLGNAARLGVQVIMRKPNGSNGLQPTPDYWVSVIHKALVGREVFDARISNGNRSHLHFYCQCTRPSPKYEKGSLTIFGINLTPEKIVVNLKNLKVKTIDKYILLPGFDAENRMFSESVLLNNVPLKLINEREMPKIRPAVVNTSKGVSLKLASGGIGFWVLPGLKIKSCESIEDDATEMTRSRKLSKRLEETESDEDDVGGGEEGQYNDNFWLKSRKNEKRSKEYSKGEKDAEKFNIKMEAERDFEKLEKLLRKRESFDDRMSSSRGRKSHYDFDDRSREKRFDGNNFEDDTSRELREKLREYKRRLKQYEYKIKRVDEPLSRAYAIDSEEMVDSEKVMEAMRLISKMEAAIRKLEIGGKANGANRQRNGVNKPQKNSNNVRSQDDAFLDKLLDSKKIKRSSVPSRIEDQLRAIYQMLADERERRQSNISASEQSNGNDDGVPSSTTPRTNFSRPRRDADKKFGVDPLGLRKEGLYRRLSRFTDETRNRRNQRKENHRDKHAFIIDSKDISDSEEDDFYGFYKREPVKGFPTGDVHLSIRNSDEEISSDYDYEMDDERRVKETSPSSWRHETPRTKLEKHKDLWVEIENPEGDRGPFDYSGNVRMSTSSRIHKNNGARRELWENESVDEKNEDFSSDEIDRLVTVEKIVPEQYPDAQQDQRTKESMVDKLISYFKAPTGDFDQTSGYGSAEELQSARIDTRTPFQITRNSNEFNLGSGFDVDRQEPEKKCVESEKGCENESCLDEVARSTAVKTIELDKSSGSSEERETPGARDTSYKITDEPAKRRKRSTEKLLEDVLDHEMINQDDNNLKDCDCRVPRSTGTATKKMKVKPRKKLNFPRKETANSARRGLRKPLGLRKNLKQAEPSILSENSEATRRKRSLNPSDQQVAHSMIEVPISVPDRRRNKEIPTTEQPELRSGEVTEDSFLNGEIINGMSETKADRRVVKRGDNSRSLSSKVSQSQADNSESEESSTTETEPTEETDDTVTTIAPNTKFFRFRKNRKESARKLNETTEKTSFSGSTTAPSVAAVRSPFYKGNKIVSSRKSVTSTTEATSSPAVPENNSEEAITKIQDTDVVLKKSPKTTNKREKPESAVSKLRRKLITTSTTSPTIPSTPAENLLEQSTTLTTETTVKLNRRNKGPTTPMSPITSPESPSEQQTTTSAPIKPTGKSNDARRSFRAKRLEQFLQKLLETSPSTPALSEPMKSNDEEKPAKLKRSQVFQDTLRTTTCSPPAAQNDTEEKSLKSNKSESLQKLQENLRQKREKLVNAYREELLSRIDAASEKNRQMYRREIVNMMMNEAELRDLVEQSKSEYLKHEKPIDYETIAKLHGQDETGIPDIPRPVTREKNPKPQTENAKATIDPELLEAGLSEAEKVGTRLNDDTANHKIARRDGEPYPGDVEISQTFKFPQPTSEQDFLQTPSIEFEKFTEWDETLENGSVGQSDKKIVPNYAAENRFDYSEEIEQVNYDSILNPATDTTIPSSELSGELENSMRDAGSHNHVLLETKPEKSSSESPEKLLKLLQQTSLVHKTSDDSGKTEMNAMHLSKKRNLKNSDFDKNSNHDSPIYTKVSMDESEFLQEDKGRERNMNAAREKGKTSKNVESIILKKKTIEPGNENTSWIVKRLIDNFQENHSAIIDYADLDEALNSGDYELVMLIPVNSNQKKHRRKRHVNNQVTRDPEDSMTNDMKIEMTPENLYEHSTIKGAERIHLNDNTRMNEIVLNRLRSMDLMKDDENDDYSMTGYSIPIIDRRLKTPNENDVERLENGIPVEKRFQSAPEIVFTLRKKSLTNEAPAELLEDTKPKVQSSVATDVEQVRRITESFEKFIDHFEDRFNEQGSQLETERDISNRNPRNNVPIDSDFFGTTFQSVKKLFNLFSEIVQVFGAD